MIHELKRIRGHQLVGKGIDKNDAVVTNKENNGAYAKDVEGKNGKKGWSPFTKK